MADLFCECQDHDSGKLMEIADYAVVGQVLKNIHPDRTLTGEFDTTLFSGVVLFQINKVYKGTIKSDSIIIDQRGTGDCMQGFAVGKEYLIFGFKKRMIPSSKEQRNNDYIINDIFSDNDVDLEKKLSDIDDFFNKLGDKNTLSYSDGCFIYSNETKVYKEIKKTAGNNKK